MERIDKPEAAKALLAAYMKPGAVFSRRFTAEELERECAEGSLFAEEDPGCLLLARRRGAHQILSFALEKGAAPPEPGFDRPTVLELAFRERDAALRATLPDWEKRGFTPVLRRVRLTRPAGDAAENAPLPLAQTSDHAAVRALLEECFDPLTGCLPTDAALASDLAAGRVLFFGDAVLRFSEGAAREVRQLAVAPMSRGRGKGGALLDAFLAAKGGGRIAVWTAETNDAALRLYESRGFAPDGWRSVVLLWKQTTFDNDIPVIPREAKRLRTADLLRAPE